MKDLFGQTVEPQSNFKGTTVFDRLAALELLTATNPRKKWTKQTVGKHAKPISLLRRRDGIEPESLDRILQFHCENIRAKYQPQAFSGESFRKKFQNIEAAYQRQAPEIDEVDISDAAKSMFTRLRMLGWQKGSLEQLTCELQIGINWCRSLRESLKRLDLRQAEAMYVKALLDRLPKNWTEQYYNQVHRRLHNWDQWNGDLAFVRMDIENKDVWRVVVSHLERYAGTKAGNQFAKKLKGLLRENQQTG